MTDKELKKIIGPSAYRCLTKNGSVLKIWRSSTPHNWWVEDKRGKTHWHSDGRGYIRPDLKLFNKIEDSNERVVNYGGFDSGKPCLSVYTLRVKNDR